MNLMYSFKKIMNVCHGKFNAASCNEWAGTLSMTEIAIAVVLFFVVLFIIFRIFHWLFGNAEVW